jgi:tRNA(fMet)-specific endonuclease VapC
VTLGYLLDTNIVSEALRPIPDARLLAHLREHETEIAIASVVWHELWYGCHQLAPSAKRSVIETYLRDVVHSTMPILPYEERAAAWHAEERARLAYIGKPPPFVDGQIAAVAVTNGLALVTFNTDDYTMFRGLRLEDWRSDLRD